MEESLLKQIVAPKNKKVKVAYSIDSAIIKDFNNICEAKGYVKSQIVENFLKLFIEQEKSLFGTTSIKN